MFFIFGDLTEDAGTIVHGDTLYEMLPDGTYRIVTAPVTTSNDLIKFVTPTSSSIGAKEAAIEAKQKIIKSLQKETPSTSVNEKIAALEEDISELYAGTDEETGLYEMMRTACEYVY